MVSEAHTVSFSGLDSSLVEVQAQISSGIAAFNIVGLPNKAIAESKERIRCSFAGLGLSLPSRRLTVNLSPANLHKEGSHFDLAIALALLVEMEIIPQEEINNFVVTGELALDSKLKSVSGVLPAAIKATECNLGIICPKDNEKEAIWSGNDSILPSVHLLELINHFTGKQVMRVGLERPALKRNQTPYDDIQDIRGQEKACRALEIAAAGRHNLLMIGPPGTGKSMLAQRLPSIMPELSNQEMLELSIIASLSGTLPIQDGLITTRPFRDPHSSSSTAALVGGGKNVYPGEVTLAHRGVLFLDELPEFNKNALDALRQPLEDKKISIARVNQHITYPADFQLIAAMNPCRCGYFGTESAKCSKMPQCAEEYQGKISGPLLERFDLQVEVHSIDPAETYYQSKTSESSEVIRKRVERAYSVKQKRQEANGRCTIKQIADQLMQDLEKDATELLKKAATKLALSMRTFDKTLKVARTIADLEDQERISKIHIAEALSYRIMRLKP